MDIKALHLKAIRQDCLRHLLGMVWRKLESDGPANAFVEFEAINCNWVNELRAGMIVSAQGVRLMVNSILLMDRPDGFGYRVRVEFDRLDAYRDMPREIMIAQRGPWLRTR